MPCGIGKIMPRRISKRMSNSWLIESTASMNQAIVLKTSKWIFSLFFRIYCFIESDSNVQNAFLFKQQLLFPITPVVSIKFHLESYFMFHRNLYLI